MRYRYEEEIKKMSVEEIVQYCHEIIDNMRYKVRNFDRDNYEWEFGAEIASRIYSELLYNMMSDKPGGFIRFLGIDVKRPYSTTSPYRIILREKAPKKLWITTADHRVSPLHQEFMRTALNSVYGRDGIKAYLDLIDEMDYLKKSEPEPWLKNNAFIPEKSGDIMMVNYAGMFDRNIFVEKQRKESIMGLIKNVIFNDPATIVYWRDGSKTVVKAQDEPFDPEKGLAMAIVKRTLGNEGNYYELFKEWLPKYEPKMVVGVDLANGEDFGTCMNEPAPAIWPITSSAPETKYVFPTVTVKDFARHCNVSEDKVRKELKTGKIPGFKHKNKWVIPASAAIDYGKE